MAMVAKQLNVKCKTGLRDIVKERNYLIPGKRGRRGGTKAEWAAGDNTPLAAGP